MIYYSAKELLKLQLALETRHKAIFKGLIYSPVRFKQCINHLKKFRWILFRLRSAKLYFNIGAYNDSLIAN